MRVLHFAAVSPHPNVTLALMGQATTALGPFAQYLGRAIRSARKRQYRYVLKWERVVNLRVLRLEALDTQIDIAKPESAWVVDNWPSARNPDWDRPLLVSNRDLYIHVERAAENKGKPRFYPRSPLYADDRVLWCGVECELTHETEPAHPRELLAEGRQLKILDIADADNGRGWRVAVEGTIDNVGIWVEGKLDDTVQVLPPFYGLEWLYDAKSGERIRASGPILRIVDLPTSEVLVGDNKVRFRWHEIGREGRTGSWIQLVTPEENVSADDYLDPRAAFVEDEMAEIWTQPRHSADSTIRVLRRDNENYQLLLEQLPPAGQPIYLPVDVRSLELQQRALRQLRESPLPHHQGLLKLCEDPARVRWPITTPSEPAQWFWLIDKARSGTEEQREFVRRALAAEDFAILEGPPGSGKTTAICELIDQFVRCGQRVLLCASTNVALDNVLERMLRSGSPLDAVRIGSPEKVDDRVGASQIDKRIEVLEAQWRDTPNLRAMGEKELHDMAERTIVMGANLTCGTTIGIIRHPLFMERDKTLRRWEKPITAMPHWDVLIVDEASKTTIQEFMVSALMAKRWIVVGDVRQLPPYVDRADVVANLRSLTEETEDRRIRDVLPADYQRALLLVFRLCRKDLMQTGMRWLITEPASVLNAVEREIAARPERIEAVRVVKEHGRAMSPVSEVTLNEIWRGEPRALLLCAATWVLVEDDLLKDVAEYLPGNLLAVQDLSQGSDSMDERSPFLFRQNAWVAERRLPRVLHERGTRVDTFDALRKREVDWLSRHNWAGEVAWRLIRIHELRRNQDQNERNHRRQDVDALLPSNPTLRPKVEEAVAEVEDIGLPSLLEVIQEGIGKDRSSRRSALTVGFRAECLRGEISGDQAQRLSCAFSIRFGQLSFQHRMNPAIAEFPRKVMYRGAALQDANTIPARDAELSWDFLPDLPSRRVWWDVDGHEYRGTNEAEIARMREILVNFIAWAKRKGPPNRAIPNYWEAACLCFYLKQEQAISKLLQELTGERRKTRFPIEVDGRQRIEIVCGVVDRFQGREADLVLLSMRNTGRVGFLDSVNRLNVALTRARQQLIVIGKGSYFAECRVPELVDLVSSTPTIGQRVRRGNPL